MQLFIVHTSYFNLSRGTRCPGRLYESGQKHFQLVVLSCPPTNNTGYLCMAGLVMVELGAITTSSRSLLQRGCRESCTNSNSPRYRGSANWSGSGGGWFNSLSVCLETVDLLDEAL